MKVADEHAGKRVKCPACQGVAVVPAAASNDFEIVEDDPPKPTAALAKARPVAATPAKPVRKPDADFDIVDDDEDEPPRRKRSSRRDDDDEDDDRPRSKRKTRRDDEDDDDRPSKRKVAAYDEDDEDDRPQKKKKKRKKKATTEASGGKRALSLIGGLVAVVAGGALAYFVWNSEASGRGVGKAIVLGIAIMVGGIGAIFNGITGNFGDAEERFDDDEDDDDRGGGDWDDD